LAGWIGLDLTLWGSSACEAYERRAKAEGGEGAVRLVAMVLLWGGLIWTVREWRYSRKNGHTITRAEKLYLAMALPLGLAAQLAVELAGVYPGSGTIVAVVIGVVLNAWAIKRRIRRRSLSL
jgi:hypothetical protein